MAVATAAAPITPLEDTWEDEQDVAGYSTPAKAAGSVAWSILVHSQELGPDLARLGAIDRDPAAGYYGHRVKTEAILPGFESEDVTYFLWELVGRAAEIGYAGAKIDLAGITGPANPMGTDTLARAVARLLRIDVVEDGEPFDPEYRARVDAAEGTPDAPVG